ncbi:hypothetical protein NA56DRAFT_295689 [Hyaloscypha hepaticicola]|uniref:Uncharacterized protein n=1 Tax=Hyaloscypha hepaticicola TaxID=2082293 RepID=A0A2J6QKE1_9HELO|nr:hypothetical protein NA56DRAFT_295689 [Hyaloscypha hepaticicola]
MHTFYHLSCSYLYYWCWGNLGPDEATSNQGPTYPTLGANLFPEVKGQFRSETGPAPYEITCSMACSIPTALSIPRTRTYPNWVLKRRGVF